MSPGVCLQQDLYISGNETSLKQIFSRHTEYFSTAFPERPIEDTHFLSVYRKTLDGIQEFQGRQLHILLLKCEGFKYARNPNALPIEQFCSRQFFGPLAIALSLVKPPYSLGNFSLKFLQILSDVNMQRNNNQPSPMRMQQSYSSNSVAAMSKDLALEICLNEMPKDQFYMYKYKTVYCPALNLKHDWNTCIYAHWVYDYRRPPDIYQYKPEICPLVAEDRGGLCKDGETCKFAHSHLEKLFHPSRYKIFPCESLRKKIQCNRKEPCAFYHNNEERRQSGATATISPILNPGPKKIVTADIEAKVGVIQIATNFFDVIDPNMGDIASGKSFEWKHIDLCQTMESSAENDTLSEHKTNDKEGKKSNWYSMSEVGSQEPDYFALFCNDNRSNGPKYSSPGNDSGGAVFIDGKFIDADSSEAVDTVNEMEPDSKLSMMCDSICNSSRGKTSIQPNLLNT
jgi:hypothetical protein